MSLAHLSHPLLQCFLLHLGRQQYRFQGLQLSDVPRGVHRAAAAAAAAGAPCRRRRVGAKAVAAGSCGRRRDAICMATGSERAHQHEHSQQGLPAASLLSSTASRCSAWAARSQMLRERRHPSWRAMSCTAGAEGVKVAKWGDTVRSMARGDKLRKPIGGQQISPPRCSQRSICQPPSHSAA